MKTETIIVVWVLMAVFAIWLASMQQTIQNKVGAFAAAIIFATAWAGWKFWRRAAGRGSGNDSG